MRRPPRPRAAASALAAAALTLAAAGVAPAQPPDRPGSDRAGKPTRVDTPPPDPTPAPGARRLAGEPDAVPVTIRPAAAARPPVISTHQIDRYDAINKLQAAVAANPKSLDDWVILGELAQEVAMDAPADQAGRYFRMARDAFENALALAPDNPGLKAAAQFARDQAANVDAFERSRDSATDAFLAARRSDLAATNHTPSVRVVAPLTPAPAPASGPISARNAVTSPATPAAAAAQAATDAKVDPAVNSPEPLTAGRGTAVPVAEVTPAVTPARGNAPATDAANYGTQQNYSAGAPVGPTVFAGPVVYQPFALPDGSPYTYQQYSSAYFPPGLYNNPALPPVTYQRYAPYAPRVVPNTLERQILNRATTPRPR